MNFYFAKFLIFRVPMWKSRIPYEPKNVESLRDFLRPAYDAVDYVYERSPSGPDAAGAAIRTGLAAAAAAKSFHRLGQLERGVFRDASWSTKLPYVGLPALAAVGHARQAVGHLKSSWRKLRSKPSSGPAPIRSSRSGTWIHSRRISRRPQRYSRVSKPSRRRVGGRYVRRFL